MESNRYFYMNILYECNSKCKYCISYTVKGHLHHVDYPFKYIQKIAKEYHINQNDTFAICGGETTICDELIDIVEYLKSLKCRIVIYTNGRLLWKKEIYHLGIKYPIRWIIPFYGLEETHDYYSGVKGAFAETFSSIQALPIEIKKYVSIKFLVREEKQISEFNELFNKFYQNFKEFNITFILDGLDGNDIEYRLSLAPKISEFISNLYSKNVRVKLSNIPLCALADNLKKQILQQYDSSKNDNYNYIHVIDGNGELRLLYDENHYHLEKCKSCGIKDICVDNCVKYMVMENDTVHLGVE